MDKVATSASPAIEMAARPRRLSVPMMVALGAAAILLGAAIVTGVVFAVSRSQAPAASAPVVGDVSTAAPSSSTPGPATARSTRQVGDWVVVCPANATSGPGCFLQQQLRTRDKKQLVLVWTITKDAGGVVRAVWDVPADIVQERGMVLDIGDGKPKGLQFSVCNKQSCTAKAVLAPDFIGSLQAASHIGAAVSAVGKSEPLRFALSSKGLAEALASLSAQ